MLPYLSLPPRAYLATALALTLVTALCGLWSGPVGEVGVPVGLLALCGWVCVVRVRGGIE